MKNFEELTTIINKYIDASKNVKPLKYTSISEEEFIECAGAYSVSMSNAIISDIRKLAVLIGGEDIETSKKLMLLSASVSSKDIQIRRMFDDNNDNRPLSEYKFEGTDDIIETLTEIKDMDIMQKDPYKTFLDRFKVWVEKIFKMDIWAFYITNYAFVKDTEEELEMGLFKEGDITFIKAQITLEKILLKSLIKIPIESGLSSDCLDRIELINGIIKIIRDGDTEKLERLYKYADAVSDFSD